MNDRLTQALEFANYRQTLNNQIGTLKIRAESHLLVAKNGGVFSINRELMCFLDFIDRRGIDEIVLLDDKNIPVKISSVKDFLNEVTVRYFEVTNDYLAEYSNISRARNVKTIVNAKDE